MDVGLVEGCMVLGEAYRGGGALAWAWPPLQAREEERIPAASWARRAAGRIPGALGVRGAARGVRGVARGVRGRAPSSPGQHLHHRTFTTDSRANGG